MLMVRDKDKYHKDENDDDGAEATVIAMRGVASPLLLCAQRTWNRIDDGTDDDGDGTDDDDSRSKGRGQKKSIFFRK